MSYVTNVMLSVGILEEVGLDQINQAIAQDEQRFTDLTGDAAGKLWGGGKNPEATVYAAAFNYLRRDELMAALTDLPWTEPACVQLFTQEQHDDTFSVFMLNGAQWRELK